MKKTYYPENGEFFPGTNYTKLSLSTTYFGSELRIRIIYFDKFREPLKDYITIFPSDMIYGEKEHEFFFPNFRYLTEMFPREINDFIQNFDTLPAFARYASVKRKKFHFMFGNAASVHWIPVFLVEDYISGSISQSIFKLELNDGRQCIISRHCRDFIIRYLNLPTRNSANILMDIKTLDENRTIFEDIYTLRTVCVDMNTVTINENMRYVAESIKRAGPFTDAFKNFMYEYIVQQLEQKSPS